MAKQTSPPVQWFIYLLATKNKYLGLGWRKVDPYNWKDTYTLCDYSDDLSDHWFNLMWDIIHTPHPRELLFVKGFSEALNLPAIKDHWRVRYWKNLQRWRKKDDPGRAGLEIIAPKEWDPRTWREWAREQTKIMNTLKNP